ncbi:DUF58 domain-containing protein [Candidatus Pacearchaeota archaeon]|nr:DUF58 domain-containing protein [Candidatus Pacearchaeota archaeon]
MGKKELNLDIAGSVSRFEALVHKVLPKNILYKILYGKGFEFDGYRDFSPQDDAGNIDWKASKRAGRTLVRKYIVERDLKVLFLIDVGENMIFGSTEKIKCEYSAELVASMSHLILTAGDRVGFILFSDQVIKMILPGFGERHFAIFRQELSNPENYGKNTDMNEVLGDLLERIDKNTTMIFLVSDFLNLNNQNKENLILLSKLFETIALVVRDPLDITFPNLNKEVVIEDPMSHEKLFVNPKVAKMVYEKNALEQTKMMRSIFEDSGMDFLELTTDSDFTLDVAEFLKERAERRRYKGNNVY